MHALLLLALGTAPLAPAEHAHAIAEGDGHHLLIHRHAEDHHGSRAPASHEHDTIVDGDDVPVLTASRLFTVPPSPYLQAPPAVLVAGYLSPTLVDTAARAGPHAQFLIHAPPRAPASLRGPPVSPAL